MAFPMPDKICLKNKTEKPFSPKLPDQAISKKGFAMC